MVINDIKGKGEAFPLYIFAKSLFRVFDNVEEYFFEGKRFLVTLLSHRQSQLRPDNRLSLGFDANISKILVGILARKQTKTT
jgi:hypothetical protein